MPRTADARDTAEGLSASDTVARVRGTPHAVIDWTRILFCRESRGYLRMNRQHVSRICLGQGGSGALEGYLRGESPDRPRGRRTQVGVCSDPAPDKLGGGGGEG